MKFILTGASGFVGKWLTEELISTGHEVTVLLRKGGTICAEWTGWGVKAISYKNSAAGVLLEEKLEARGAVFIHLGWGGTSGNARASFEVQLKNVQLTCDMACLASKLRCKRFIYAGSIMEYETINNFSHETFVPAKSNIYSIAKLAADYMARTIALNYEMEYLNVVISNVYGIGEKSGRFLNTVLRKMIKNETVEMTEGTQLYDFMYVSDAVRAIRLVAERGKNGGCYYIGNSRQYPLRQYVLKMKEILKSNSEIEFGKVVTNGPSFDYAVLDVARIQREFGFVPEILFEDGIHQMKEWVLQENGKE